MATVLVVDDKTSIRLSSEEFLRTAGYRVFTADSAAGARAVLNEHEVDAMLLDILLGSDNGIDVARFVRKTYPKIQIVLMTGEPSLDTATAAIHLRLFDFIPKPVGKDKLLSATAKAVAAKQHEDEYEVLRKQEKNHQDELERSVELRTRELEASRRRLAKSEERFRYAMDATVDGLWDWDICTGHAYFSPSWSHILGEEDLPSARKTWETRIHPDESEAVLDSLNSYLKGKGRRWSHEHRLRKRDGEYVWVCMHGEVVDRDDQGCPLRMIGTTSDISLSKRLEKALRDSEDKFRTLIDQAGDALFVHDMEGNLVDVNAMAVRRYGYSRQELLGLKVHDIDPGTEERDDAGNFWGDIALEGPVGLETEHKDKNGQIFPVEVTLSAVIIGGQRHILSLAHDISARKEAADALHKMVAEWKKTFDAVNDGVALISVDGTLLRCNAAMATLLGRDEASLIGHKCWEVVHKSDGPISGCPVQRMRETLVRETMDLELGGRWLRVIADPIFGSDGTVVGAVHIVTDISAQKRIEDSLRESEAQFKQLAETIRGVFYIVDPDSGRFLYVSPGYSDVWQKPAQSLYADPSSLMDSVHEDDKHLFEESAKRGRKEGEYYENEFRIVLPDGTLRWLWSHNYPVVSEGGVVDRIVGICEDITPRKLAEQKLRYSEANLSALISSSDDCLWSIDKDYRLIVANAVFYNDVREILETDIAEGDSVLWEELPDSVAAEWRGYYDRGLAGESFRVDTRQYDKAEPRWMEYSFNPIRDASDSVIGVTACARDVTGRHETEMMLRESEARYRKLFEAVPDPIMLFDAESRSFVDVNQAALKLYGYNREEFLDLNHSAITAEPDESNKSIRETMDGAPSHIPVRYHRKKNGDVFPVEISGCRFVLGARRMLCGVVRDITQRMEAERRLGGNGVDPHE